MKKLYLAGLLVKLHSFVSILYRKTKWQWLFAVGCFIYQIGSKLYDEDHAAYRRVMWKSKVI